MTVAPATTAPLGSTIVPEMLDVGLAKAAGPETIKRTAKKPRSTALQLLLGPRNPVSGVIMMVASKYATQSQQASKNRLPSNALLNEIEFHFHNAPWSNWGL